MVIISGDLLNTYLPVVIVCPLTSKIKKYKGNVILNPDGQNNLKAQSEILTFHVRSIAKDRLIRKIGIVTKSELEMIKQGLDDILRY